MASDCQHNHRVNAGRVVRCTDCGAIADPSVFVWSSGQLVTCMVPEHQRIAELEAENESLKITLDRTRNELDKAAAGLDDHGTGDPVYALTAEIVRLRAELKEAKTEFADAREEWADIERLQARDCIDSRRSARRLSEERDAAIARADGVPDIPPLDRIRALAREVGYAIGVHGSQARDLDLIAAPWVDEAVDANTLVAHLATGLGAVVIGPHATKPLGRVAFTLQIDGWFKPIDLSVCPSLRDAIARAEKAEREIEEWQDASGLCVPSEERGGDPGGVRPKHLRTFLAELDADLARERALADRLAAAFGTEGWCHACERKRSLGRAPDCPVAEHAAARKAGG